MERKPFTIGCLVSDSATVRANSGNSTIWPVDAFDSNK